MTIELSYYLLKRKLSLEQFCKKNNLKSHSEVCDFLSSVGVGHPSGEDTLEIFRPKKVSQKVKSTSQKNKKIRSMTKKKIYPQKKK
jgi:hypothetical protein